MLEKMVEFAGEKRRDDAVPILVLKGAGDLHALAKRIGVIDLEADDLARGVDAFEGSVARIHADADRFPFLGACGRGHEARCQSQQGQELHCLHSYLLILIFAVADGAP